MYILRTGSCKNEKYIDFSWLWFYVILWTFYDIQSGTKISGCTVEIAINKVSINMTYLYKDVNINFDYLLNNPCIIVIYNK